MGKVKVKKHAAVIDMTAMSDVTVLLLTFFMLTATFLPKEPVRVITPASVSMRKVPVANVLTVLIDPQGRVFLNFDRPDDKKEVLQKMGERYGLTFNDRQTLNFVNQTHVGLSMDMMSNYLSNPASISEDEVKKMGVPTDTTDNFKACQLADWVSSARLVNNDIAISIKADQSTPYPVIKKVMKILVHIKENRYSLITTLRKMPAGF